MSKVYVIVEMHDYREDCPVHNHKDVWDFYDMIGWEWMKKRYKKP